MTVEPTPEDQELQELQGRQRHLRGPEPMGRALDRLLARRGYAQVATADARQAAWRRACGERLAAHTRAGAVRRGVLEVFVRNSAVLQELAFQQEQLVRQLAELAPDERINSLKLRIGAVA